MTTQFKKVRSLLTNGIYFVKAEEWYAAKTTDSVQLWDYVTSSEIEVRPVRTSIRCNLTAVLGPAHYLIIAESLHSGSTEESNPTVSDFIDEQQGTFESNVVQWAVDRNIINGGSIDAQVSKLQEEFDELKAALAKNDIKEVADAIGDMNVVLTILAAMKGLRLTDCQKQAWNEIKDRKGQLINGTFVKEADLDGNQAS